MEEFELPQLTKLQTNIPKAEDIKWCGSLEQYDEQYDRISTRTEKRLQVRVFLFVFVFAVLVVHRWLLLLGALFRIVYMVAWRDLLSCVLLCVIFVIFVIF